MKLTEVFILQILVSISDGADQLAPDCQQESVIGYGSLQGCILNSIQTNQLKVVYLDKQYVTQNQVAIAKAKANGNSYAFAKTCENPATAVPEWFGID